MKLFQINSYNTCHKHTIFVIKVPKIYTNKKGRYLKNITCKITLALVSIRKRF